MKRFLIGLSLALSTTSAFAQGQDPGSSGTLPPVDPPPAASGDPPPGDPPPAAPPPAAPPPAPAPPPGAAPPPGSYPPGAYPPGSYPPGAYPPGAAPAGPYPPGAYRPPPPPPERVRNVSLTLSPLHLLLPIVELTAEVRLVNHFSAAVLGGYGSVSTDTEKFAAYELGAQLLAHPMQPFHGLQLGVELLYLKIDADDLQDGKVRGSGTGLAVGPLVGYKLLTSGGFTFVAQGGVQYLAVKAEASDNAGNSAEADDNDFIPLLNLNLGYSF